MAYEFLQKLFGTPKDGEQPKAMTFEELEAAIAADKGIQVVDLKAGGYVSKDKFDAKDTELKGVKQQLTDANEQIQSFKGKAIDIEAANQKVSEWETKYNTDTQALKDQLATQARSHAEDMFFSDYKFTSKAARRGILDEFRAQEFKMDDNGTFNGGKEYMESLMKNEDYKGAFVVEEPPKEEPPKQEPPQGRRFGQQYPRFAGGTAGGNARQDGDKNPFLDNMGLARLHNPPKQS